MLAPKSVPAFSFLTPLIMNKIRFGMCGTGFMGRTHAEAIRRLDSVASLTAVWGGSRAEALAKDYGAAVEPTMEGLIRRKDVDAIVIATPHHLHVDEALLAFSLGKHAMIEKPITTTVADADRLIAAAEKTKSVIGIVYQQRFRMNNAKACELLRAGAIGKVLTVQVSMPLYKGEIRSGNFGGTWAWWDDPQSVGHLINSFPHAIDLMRWCLQAEVKNVSAFSRTFTPGLKVEDTTMAMIEMSNGTLFSLLSSNAFPTHPFPDEDFRFRIMGTTGLMDLNPYKELRVTDEKGEWKVASFQPPVGATAASSAFGDVRMAAYVKQVQAFLDGIAGKPMACGNGKDGRAGIAACEAMLTSSREHRWVQP